MEFCIKVDCHLFKICYNWVMSEIEKNYEDFISTVSHELRTPLTSIRGFSQTMLNSWDMIDDESKKRFLKIIEEQSNRLINLVENMLSITRISGGKEGVILKEINVKPVIETVVSVVKGQHADKTFEININEKTPSILADKDKFQQILTNIIENAAKYGDMNSSIKIETGFCKNCEFVSIKISNTGDEIKEEDFERIFTKFSRIDSPLTRRVQGSGLGLYITKNLVEKMDGKISVKSEKQNDKRFLTTFEVSMPAGDVEKQARAKCSR